MRIRITAAFILLMLALSACTYTTDTAATVASQRITVGEFNAQVANLREQVGTQRWDGATEEARREVKTQLLNQMIDDRLVQIEARSRGISVSDAEIRAKMDADRADFAQGFAQQRQQGFEQLAAGAAQQLRPLVNVRGGAGLPDDDLRALLRAEIERLQAALDGRGQVVDRAVPESIITDRAAALAAALSGKGVTIAATELEPLLQTIAGQLADANFGLDDNFERNLRDEGIASGGAYRDRVRDRLVVEKLRPLYAKDQVTAVTLQQLIADRPEQAEEALKQARGGAQFNELVQRYAVETFKSEQVVNAGSGITESFSPELRNLFPSVQEGAYSDVQAVQDGRGQTYYRFFRVAKVEQRPPGADDLNGLRQQWVQSLRDKYPVTINPALNLPNVSRQ